MRYDLSVLYDELVVMNGTKFEHHRTLLPVRDRFRLCLWVGCPGVNTRFFANSVLSLMDKIMLLSYCYCGFLLAG
jgi:hypothetical protein